MSNHEEIRALLGVFALDAVDGEEYEAVELHLRYCPQCRAEVAEHREVAAMIGHGGAPAPAGVWDRIVDALEPAPPRMRIEVDHSGGGSVVPLAPRAPSDRSRSLPSRLLVAALAAAAVLAIVMGLAVVRLDQHIDKVDRRSQPGLEEVAGAALVEPGTRKAELRSADRKMVADVALTPDGQGFLLAGAMPALADNATYQLWGVVGEETISLGTFDGGVAVVPFRVDPSVKGLAVTEERVPGVAVSGNQAVLSGDIPA